MNEISTISSKDQVNLNLPIRAVKEALVNSLQHRNYKLGGNTVIKINNLDMEITSYGGLVDGLDLNDLTNGITKTRNPNISYILSELGLCQSFGTGIGSIYDDYSKESRKPKINVTSNTFQIKLPNRSFKSPNMRQTEPIKLIDKQVKILTYLKENPKSEAQEIMDATGIKKGALYNNIKKLSQLGLINFEELDVRKYFLTDRGKMVLS